MEELVCTTLNNGVKLPAIGFNTSWECPSDQAALRSALTSGYRLLDTDPSAGNEIEIGQVLHDYFHRSFSREEVFISTKADDTGDDRIKTVLRAWKIRQADLFNDLKLVYLCRRSGVHVMVHLDPDQAAISWVTESSGQGKQCRKSAMQIAGRFFLERGMSVIIHEKDPDEIHKAFKMLDFCLSPEDVASLVTRRLVPSGF